MKKRAVYQLLSLLVAMMTVSSALTSCNAKSEGENEPEYQPSISVAVKSFKLNPNAGVMANLDSVFFSIDLNHGIIFNADSLPKGTPIDRLVPVITFPATVETAEIVMAGGKRREGTVNYLTNPSDTLDFSGSVILRLTANKGALSRDYKIKVNVHNAVADSLMWDKMAATPLPSRFDNPKQQKSVARGEKTFSLIEENDGSYTLSTTGDIASARWSKNALSLNFTPQVSSLTATTDKLYLLCETGEIMVSVDGLTWSPAGEIWTTILGGYGDKLLGISQDTSADYVHAMYPATADFQPSKIASDFPLEGASNMLSFSSKWSDEPYAYLVGGRRDGRTLSATWCFDGTSWAKISNNPLPAMTQALIVPYFVYRKTSTSWIQTEYSVTLCLGGRLSDGKLSRKVYLSYDSGVNWREAGALMQLPDDIPSFRGADAVIQSTSMQTSIDNWAAYTTPKPTGARIQYNIDGSQVEWECPYIYVFGGYTAGDKLIDVVRRGVLARLTFAPLF